MPLQRSPINNQTDGERPRTDVVIDNSRWRDRIRGDQTIWSISKAEIIMILAYLWVKLFGNLCNKFILSATNQYLMGLVDKIINAQM